MIDIVVVGEPFPEMVESLRHDDVNLIVEEFKGYNRSLNNGFKKSTSDIVGFCNNDLIFHEGAIDKLKQGLKEFDSVSAWCPKTHHQWWKGVRPKSNVQGYITGKIITGWCIFMKCNTWLEISWDSGVPDDYYDGEYNEFLSGFDERLEFWCSDNSYTEQLKQAELKHALIVDALVTHLQSQTLNKKSRPEYDRLTKQQVKLFNKLYNKNLFGLGC